MKKLPLGIQSFRTIIEGGYVYADKTQYVYDLINNVKYYFLSRPRRFGKSLLLDTIAEAFSGDKGLFKGLYIYDTDFDFLKHPVLRLDMSNISNKTPEDMEVSLSGELYKRIQFEELNISTGIPSDMFKFLIEALYNKYNQRVVILIDEYDKPILDHIDDINTAEANRKILRSFYGILKSMDPFLEFSFITGVTKFTKTSIFSELNNLLDITLLEDYANICGITAEDLFTYFDEHTKNLSASKKFQKYANIYDEIISWYDGYSWDGETRVINPFSLLSFYTQKKFSNFWYSSGTPKFLMDLLKRRQGGFTDVKNIEMSEWALDSFDITNIEIESLLFQTGYLTVIKILPDSAPAVYVMGIPNYEVNTALNLQILAEFTEKGEIYAETAYRKIKDSLQTGNLKNMLSILKRLFASIPYQLHISNEAYYHSIFYAIMNLLGFDVDAEVSVSGGRIDGTLELDDKIYVIEFKYENYAFDSDAAVKQNLLAKVLDAGMKQIEDRGYCNKFAGSQKTIYQVVFAFLGRDEIDMRYNII